MPAPDVELWAACGTCDRSFFVPSDALDAPDALSCPVCAEVPEHVEERTGNSVVGVHALAPEPLG